MYRISWSSLLIGLVMLVLACGLTSVVVEEPTAPTETRMPRTATPIPPTSTPPPPTEIPTSTPPSGQVISQATGFCRHPFYPVRSDTTWQYQTQVGEAEPTEISVTFENIGADAFTYHQTSPGSTAETVWQCNETGLIPSELTSFLPVEFPGFEFETLDHSGALLPPPADWVAGTTWETGYTVQATTKVLGISISTQAVLSVENHIAGVEQVVAPAGAYPQATRIDSEGTALIEGAGSQTQAGFSFSHWYVEGVGLVRLSAEVQGTAFDMELVSVKPKE